MQTYKTVYEVQASKLIVYSLLLSVLRHIGKTGLHLPKASADSKDLHLMVLQMKPKRSRVASADTRP